MNRYHTHFIACTKDAGLFSFNKRRMENNEIVLLKNAIDIEKFRYKADKRKQLQEKYNLSNSVVIGHIGRFEPQKNHNYILEIFNKINDKNNKYKLMLIGEGKLKEKNKEENQNNGDSR